MFHGGVDSEGVDLILTVFFYSQEGGVEGGSVPPLVVIDIF